MRQLVLIGSIGEHRPDFRVATLPPFENDMAYVGSPGREVICACVVRQLLPPFGRDVHNVDVLTARRPWPILAIPAERQKLAA